MSKLDPRELRTPCSVEQFDFETTADLEDLEEILGQTRAVDAIRFGLGMGGRGFNLFAMGPSGIGKRHALSLFLEERAPGQATPQSWCYVHNFDEPNAPLAIALEPGQATQARQALDELVAELEVAIRSVVTGDDFRSRRRTIAADFDQRREDALEAVAESAEAHGLVLEQTPDGFSLSPLFDEEGGESDQPDELSDEEQERIDEEQELVGATLRATLEEFPASERERRDAIVDLQSSCVANAVEAPFDRLRTQFEDNEEFVAHLDALEASLVKDPAQFLPVGADDGVSELGRHPGIERFSVNVIVDHDLARGAPIVYEDDPTYENLHGRVEYDDKLGGLSTNFALIRSGSLHKANGGYLVVNARKLLADSQAWGELKRTLYAGEVRVPSRSKSGMAPRSLSLDPDPIPLAVKVIMVGVRDTYYALRDLDPDMDELFKVMADFESEMPRTTENVVLYARLMATYGRTKGLRPFDPSAVARVVEVGARMSGDARKLSTHMRYVVDLLRACDYWAAQEGAEVVTAAHVESAVEQERKRNGRLRDAMLDQIVDERINVATEGAVVGQVNALSIIQFGTSMFGRPNRVSATAAPGRDLIDIEREVDLGGPIHSKGVMILRGFLAQRFGRVEPLSLAANIVFEQSYGPIDGDSASAGEACALLSAIAELPIRQQFAMTGAIDQHGRIQAVGGVDAKIEGFFEVCATRGLTGTQGVLIPFVNVKGLMLSQEVVDAVDAGTFSVHGVSTIDEAMELLTGVHGPALDEVVLEKLAQFGAVWARYRL